MGTQNVSTGFRLSGGAFYLSICTIGKIGTYQWNNNDPIIGEMHLIIGA